MLHSTNANSSHTSDNEKVFKTTLHPALQQEKSVDGKGKTDGPLSMMELVVEVSDILQKAKVGGTTIDYDRMQAAMENFDAAGNEWKRFEYWDYDKRYTRNLIATDDETFSLMLLCWNPDNESPIHAHAGSECYVRTIQGEVEETLYHWPEKGHEDEPLKVKGVISAKAGEVCHLNDTMGVHKVANPSKSKGAITLHCYIPPYDACKCFFDNNGKPTVSTSSFDTEHGEKISERRSSNLSSLTG